MANRILIVGLICVTAGVAVRTSVAQSPGDLPLTKMLTARSEVARERILTRLETDPRLKYDRLDDLLAAAADLAPEFRSDQPPRPSTMRLLRLIGTIDRPEVEAAMGEFLESDRLELAMQAADTIGEQRLTGAIEMLKRQTNRAEFEDVYAFRFTIVRALLRIKHPDAVEYLSTLEPKLDGRLGYLLDRELGLVDVEDFAGDEERFAAWRKEREVEPSGMFRSVGFESDSRDRIRFEKSSYYGIDIHAKRMLFVIDHSGSMRSGNPYSRLDRAKEELVRVIESLPENASFGILFFASGVRSWRDSLVDATRSNKDEALEFVRRLGYGDRTNTHAALRRALVFDSDLESVFVLTDGRPTRGQLVAPAAILEDILRRNRFRHVNFNTIGLDVGGGTEAFLERLAQETGGEFKRAG